MTHSSLLLSAAVIASASPGLTSDLVLGGQAWSELLAATPEIATVIETAISAGLTAYVTGSGCKFDEDATLPSIALVLDASASIVCDAALSVQDLVWSSGTVEVTAQGSFSHTGTCSVTGDVEFKAQGDATAALTFENDSDGKCTNPVEVDGTLTLGGSVSIGAAAAAKDVLAKLSCAADGAIKVAGETTCTTKTEIEANGQVVIDGTLKVGADVEAAIKGSGSADASSNNEVMFFSDGSVEVESNSRLEINNCRLDGKAAASGSTKSKAIIETAANSIVTFAGDCVCDTSTEVKGQGKVAVEGSLTFGADTTCTVQTEVKGGAEIVIEKGAKVTMGVLKCASDSKAMIAVEAAATAEAAAAALTCTEATFEGELTVDMSAYASEPEFDVVICSATTLNVAADVLANAQVKASWSASASAGRRLLDDGGCIKQKGNDMVWTHDCPDASSALASVSLCFLPIVAMLL